MPQYDFLNLSPVEFENLSRDLLQKEFNVHIESFTEGRDGGIDLRFANITSSNEIIQCKRYKDYNSLIANLKKEAIKVKSLKPTRYYITTSIGLTPKQKEDIYKLFNNYIKLEADIFGKDDLNNLLSKYPSIESQYYKLWLSSTNILQKVLHSKVYNQSKFEIEEIQALIRIYVQNESFEESLKILNDNHFVIISGIPGIGKTTLARILIYHLLSKGFDEFVFLNDSISEAYSYFQEDKKQVFLFDDFLGRNFLETSIGKNEEQSIIRFIEKISKSVNKALIFTTREYILKQAQIKHEAFNKSLLDKSKYVVDLSKYTKIVKAQILYNHIYFSDLPNEYIAEILKDKFYLKLINHKNYNPRIIETFTKSKIWDNIQLNAFQNQLQKYFDYPDDVWRHAYEIQITNLSKCVLAVMVTTGSPILYEDLFRATQNFATEQSDKYDFKFNEPNFRKAIKELENTFIITEKDNKAAIAIAYQNPSIQDFLVNYLSEQNDFLGDLIDSAIFFNQLSSIFTSSNAISTYEKQGKPTNKITLKKGLIERYIKKIMNNFDALESSVIVRYLTWEKKTYSDIKKLKLLSDVVSVIEYTTFKEFTKEKLFKLLDSESWKLSNDDLEDCIILIEVFKEEPPIKASELIKLLALNVSYYSNLQDFKLISNIYPNEYDEFENSEFFRKELLYQIVENEYDNAHGSNLYETLDILETLKNEYEIDIYVEIDNIRERINEYELSKEYEKDLDYYNKDVKQLKHKSFDIDEQINKIFNGLRYV